MHEKIIEIDGSYLEGGGQIIRTAVALSSVSGKPCKIYNIRGKRENPGLQAQHLTGINAVGKICNAQINGANIGSKEIEFYPDEISGGFFYFDIRTAGAISLVLQSLLIPAIHAKEIIEIRIKGGTAVRWSPSMAYFQHVFCDYMKRIGIEIFVNIEKEGFYPKGGGIVFVKIIPCKKLKPINILKRGNLKKINVYSIASNSLKNSKVVERQINGFQNIFSTLGHKINFKSVYFETLSPGSYIHAHAHYKNATAGTTCLGEKGKKSENVGKECASELQNITKSPAPFDRYMEDQIIPYMALSAVDNKMKNKIMVSEITNHTKTNIWVVEKFLPVKFSIKNKEKIILCSNLK